MVLIRFKHRKISKDALIQELKNAYNTRNDNTSSFGIKITEAGSYYLTLLPKFEYFSCRYYSNSRPLYLIDNIKPINNGNVSEKSFLCYKYIEKVKKQTIGYTNSTGVFVNGCIQEIYNSDVSFFTNKRFGCNFDDMYKGNYLYKHKNSTYGMSQIKSIIVNHIGHLDGFRGFILFFNEDKSTSSEYVVRDHKKILAGYILNVIEEYVEKLKEYADECDSSGVYYIDHYTRKNDERMVEILIRQLSINLLKERHKLDKGDLSFSSLFDKIDE